MKLKVFSILFRKEINKTDHKGGSQTELAEEGNRHDRNAHRVQRDVDHNQEEASVELDSQQFKELFCQDNEDPSGGAEGDLQDRRGVLVGGDDRGPQEFELLQFEGGEPDSGVPEVMI